MRSDKKELYSNKSNAIIQSYAWALREKQLKIMELLCSCYMTNYYNKEENTITIGLADFMRELGYTTTDQGGWAYKDFKKTIKALSDTSIIGIGFSGNERLIRLINTFEFQNSKIKCFMSEDFKQSMMLQSSGNTKIEFKTIYSMESRFSIKLYNLLRSWQGKEEVYFDLDYLKELLNVTAKSYDNFGKLRQAVLDVAVNEINKKTSLNVTYTPLTGRGRKVTRVAFYISNKAANKASTTQNSSSEALEPEQIPEDIQIFRGFLRDGGREFTDEQVRAMRVAALSSPWAAHLRQIPDEADMVEVRLKNYVEVQEMYARANSKIKGGLANFLIQMLLHDGAKFFDPKAVEEDEDEDNEGKQLDLPSFFENA